VGPFLVLGGTGFIGRALTDVLRARGARVTTVARGATPEARAAQDHYPLDAIEQFDSLRRLVLDLQPTAIINLIGGRSVQGHDAPLFAYRLVRFLAETRVGARVVLVGSAAEYGLPASLPVQESHPLRPTTVYGFAKAVQSWTALNFYEAYGLPVFVARVFNAIGPGQGREFFAGSVVAQAVEIAAGRQAVAEVGAVDAARDFVDVRDVARALVHVLLRGRPGEAYNVCSGRPVPLREVLREVGLLCGLREDFYVVTAGRDATSTPEIYGSNEKIKRDTGWAPTIGMEDSLRAMIAAEVARPRAAAQV